MENRSSLYNSRHGFFNRREMRMLARALALPDERLERRLTELSVEDSIRISDFLTLIERGVFWTDFHRVFNNRGGFYNSLVFSKAIKLIDAHLFSFDEIQRARLAFDLYEMSALNNDQDKVQLILETIKFCNYRISRMKLEQRLKHFDLQPTEILHLCQYFDILLDCSRQNQRFDSSKTKLIDLVNPKPEEQRVMEKLNENYLHEERNWFFQERFPRGQLIENPVWPAKILHKQQVNEGARRKEQLQRQLSDSVSLLKASRAGSPCTSRRHITSASLRRSRPTSTPSFEIQTPVTNSSREGTPRPHTTMNIQSFEHLNVKTVGEHIEQLRSESSLLAAKYAVHTEDYIKELLPPGYVKPIIVQESLTPRRVKKRNTTFVWSRRSFSRLNMNTIVV